MRGSKKLVLTPEQRQELEAVARESDCSRVRDRARGVLGVADGLTRCAVARLLRVERSCVRRWIEWFLEEGSAGLPDAPRPGKAPALSRTQAQEICVIACQMPTRFGYATNSWSLALLQKEIERRWALKVSDETVRRELHRGNLRFKSPKLHLHSPDPEYARKRGQWSA